MILRTVPLDFARYTASDILGGILARRGRRGRWVRTQNLIVRVRGKWFSSDDVGEQEAIGPFVVMLEKEKFPEFVSKFRKVASGYIHRDIQYPW